MESLAGIFSGDGTAERDGLLLMAGEHTRPGQHTWLLLDDGIGMAATGSGAGLSGTAGGHLHLILDGNIYNAPELRDSLGLPPETDQGSVVLEAYARWREETLARLNGDFAFAIWDSRERELFLARDRFGVRPLFLLRAPGRLAFASSSRALLRLPEASRELSAAAVVQTFQLWSTLPGQSAFTGITELPAGSCLRIGTDLAAEPRRWWELDFSGPERTDSPTELAGELLELLDDAVRLRAADAPAAYISGGFDSAATTALLREQQPESLHGYAIGFDDALFDETAEQDAVAAALGVPVSRIGIGDRHIAAAFPDVIRHSERPMLRTAPAPLLHLAQLTAADDRGAVVTGEGADEIFAGYAIFKELAVRRFWARQPDSKLRPLLFARLNPYVAQDLSRAGSMLGSYYGADLLETDDPLYSHSNRFRNGRRNLRFLLPEAAEQAGDPERELLELLPARFSAYGPLGRAQYLEVRTFLEGYLLPSQADRMLRAAGLEGRFPFLDHRLAEFAARLPEKLRLNGLQEKYLLRQAVRPLLPAVTSGRVKQPYRAPLLRPFLGPGAPAWVAELLEPANLERSGLFAVRRVDGLRRKSTQNLDRGVSEMDEMALIGVLSTLLLKDAYVDNPQLAPPAVPAGITDLRVAGAA